MPSGAPAIALLQADALPESGFQGFYFMSNSVSLSRAIVRVRTAFRTLTLIGGFLGAATVASAGPYLLVGGALSNDIVRFDLESGSATKYADFSPLFAAPRELARNAAGEVFVSTSQGHQNVMKLVPQVGTDLHLAVDFTVSIGSFGPGQLQFYNGDLYVAGDTTRDIRQYDGDTGAFMQNFSVPNSFNIRGMQIVGDKLYYAEIFQERIREMDLTQNPPSGSTLFVDTVHLVEPGSMGTGKDGHLLFTNRENGLVTEYDQHTGTFIRTIVDLATFDPLIPQIGNLDKGVVYFQQLDQYFVSARDKVYRLDSQGQLLQTYQSNLLQGAYGLLLVPEPKADRLLFVGIVCAAAMCLVVRRRKLASNLVTR
jgi:outer membrane protein assembly factor BamB